MPKIVEEPNYLLDANSNRRSQDDPNLLSKYDINYSHNSVVFIENYDEPYCLKRIVNGRTVEKFKKDSRVWLHKSSTKRKRDYELNDSTVEYISHEYAEKLEKDTGNAMTVDDYMRRCHMVRSPPIPIPDAGRRNIYNRSPIRDELALIESDLASLGDPDADLTYSEESIPSESQSCLNLWHQQQFHQHVDPEKHENDSGIRGEIIQSNLADSDSFHSCQTGTTASSPRPQHPFECKSLEDVDIADEYDFLTENTTNSAIIARKIAPAIDIELEMLRDDYLDRKGLQSANIRSSFTGNQSLFPSMSTKRVTRSSVRAKTGTISKLTSVTGNRRVKTLFQGTKRQKTTKSGRFKLSKRKHRKSGTISSRDATSSPAQSDLSPNAGGSGVKGNMS